LYELEVRRKEEEERKGEKQEKCKREFEVR